MPSTLFLYSWIGGAPGTVAARIAASSITRSPALSQITDVARGGHLGRGELGVGVVDVEPGAVGEDDVGRAEVVELGVARRVHVGADRSNPRASRSGDSTS